MPASPAAFRLPEPQHLLLAPADQPRRGRIENRARRVDLGGERGNPGVIARPVRRAAARRVPVSYATGASRCPRRSARTRSRRGGSGSGASPPQRALLRRCADQHEPAQPEQSRMRRVHAIAMRRERDSRRLERLCVPATSVSRARSPLPPRCTALSRPLPSARTRARRASATPSRARVAELRHRDAAQRQRRPDRFEPQSFNAPMASPIASARPAAVISESTTSRRHGHSRHICNSHPDSPPREILPRSSDSSRR